MLIFFCISWWVWQNGNHFLDSLILNCNNLAWSTFLSFWTRIYSFDKTKKNLLFHISRATQNIILPQRLSSFFALLALVCVTHRFICDEEDILYNAKTWTMNVCQKKKKWALQCKTNRCAFETVRCTQLHCYSPHSCGFYEGNFAGYYRILKHSIRCLLFAKRIKNIWKRKSPALKQSTYYCWLKKFKRKRNWKQWKLSIACARYNFRL